MITILVTNTGNTYIDSVTDELSDINGQIIENNLLTTYSSSNKGSSEGTLLVGETATYTASYVLTQEAVNVGGLSNSATVTSSLKGQQKM